MGRAEFLDHLRKLGVQRQQTRREIAFLRVANAVGDVFDSASVHGNNAPPEVHQPRINAQNAHFQTSPCSLLLFCVTSTKREQKSKRFPPRFVFDASLQCSDALRRKGTFRKPKTTPEMVAKPLFFMAHKQCTICIGIMQKTYLAALQIESYLPLQKVNASP